MLKEMLERTQFGIPRWGIRITEVSFSKALFLEHFDREGDKIFERYSFALKRADSFKNHLWHLTDLGYLVCGEVEDLPVLYATININNNLDFLGHRCPCESPKVRDGYAVGAKLDGSSPSFKEERILSLSFFDHPAFSKK